MIPSIGVLLPLKQAAKPTPSIRATGSLRASSNVQYLYISGSYMPAYQVGDILILTAFTKIATNIICSGWNLITSINQAGGSMAVFWKYMADTSVTSANPKFVTNVGTDGGYVKVISVSGCASSGNPYEDVQVTSLVTTQYPATPATTSLGANRLSLPILIIFDNNTANSYTSGYTLFESQYSTVGSDATIALFTREILATGTVASQTVSAGRSDPNYICSLILKP